MERLMFILVFVFLVNTVFSTQQMPDLIILNNKKGILYTDFTSSPLEKYFIEKYGESPFKMTSTANYKGHISFWEIDKDILYIKKIIIPGFFSELKDFEIDKKILFNLKNNVIRYKADWYTGILSIRMSNIDFKSNYLLQDYYKNKKHFKKYLELRIENGVVKENNKEIIDLNDKSNEIEKNKFIESNVDEIKKEYKKIKKGVHEIYNIRVNKIQENLKKEKDEDLRKCYEIYSKLDGYEKSKEEFNIEDTNYGGVNFKPNSIFLQLKSKKDVFISSIWWWNPLKNKKVEYNWKDLFEYHKMASTSLGKYKWIKAWKDMDDKNEIEIQVLGNGIGETDKEIENWILPSWKHAGLKGIPKYSILLRSNPRWFAQIYFNEINDKLLIDFITDGSNIKMNHWLYENNIHFHHTQDIPEYIIVDKEGKWYMNSKSK